VVPGGGVALVHAGKVLDGFTGENPDQAAGVKIVVRALEQPLRQIAENSGVDGSVVAGKIRESSDRNFGFDAQNPMRGYAIEQLLHHGRNLLQGLCEERLAACNPCEIANPVLVDLVEVVVLSRQVQKEQRRLSWLKGVGDRPDTFQNQLVPKSPTQIAL